jgi:hypothetical protein
MNNRNFSYTSGAWEGQDHGANTVLFWFAGFSFHPHMAEVANKLPFAKGH